MQIKPIGLAAKSFYMFLACFRTLRPYFDKFGDDFLAQYTADADKKILELKSNKNRLQGIMKSDSVSNYFKYMFCKYCHNIPTKNNNILTLQITLCNVYFSQFNTISFSQKWHKWLLSFTDLLKDLQLLHSNWNFTDTQLVAVLKKIAKDIQNPLRWN